MNVIRMLAILGVLAPVCLFGQNVPDSQVLEVDPVLEAIRNFNARQEEPLAESTPVADEEKPASAETPSEPPKAEHLSAEPRRDISPPAPTVPTEDARLTVDVEKLQTGKGSVQTGTVKLLSPFPPKPLTSVPAGWQLDAQADVPLIHKEVELGPDQKITLTIRPHLLIPTVDGDTTFAIREPGYNPNLGYQQTTTIGAILSNSLQQLDEDAKLLGNAIDQLQQLLVSLPNPEIATPETTELSAPAPPPAPRRTR
ncbi:MAG: hypothetical protein QM627_07220 [Luteolibacter sp.]